MFIAFQMESANIICLNANTLRSSDGLKLKLPTEMAEIKVAKKTIFFPGKDSWSSPQNYPPR